MKILHCRLLPRIITNLASEPHVFRCVYVCLCLYHLCIVCRGQQPFCVHLVVVVVSGIYYHVSIWSPSSALPTLCMMRKFRSSNSVGEKSQIVSRALAHENQCFFECNRVQCYLKLCK